MSANTYIKQKQQEKEKGKENKNILKTFFLFFFLTQKRQSLSAAVPWAADSLSKMVDCLQSIVSPSFFTKTHQNTQKLRRKIKKNEKQLKPMMGYLPSSV